MASKTKIRGITIELNSDTTGLSKSLSNVNGKIRDTQAQLKDVEKLLKLDPKNTELLAQKQRLLKDAVGQTKEKLDLLKQAREQANEALARGDENAQRQLDALQREIIETEDNLKSLTKEAEDFDEKGGKHFEGAGEKLKNAFKTAAKVAVAAIVAIAAAAVDMGKKLVQSANEVAEYGDNIDKMSQKLGISAEAYQEWDAVLQHSGTSIESLLPAMKNLSTKARKGSDAFKALGISQKEAANLSREALFNRTVTALQNVTDANKRAALAQELFGKSAQELGPLLNTSAAETQAMKDRVHELGGVMSDEAVRMSAKYRDSMQDMQTALDGMKRRFVSEFLPAITKVMNGLTLLFSGKSDDGKISEGLDKFIETLNRMIPKIVEAGGELILKLGESIVSQLPTLVPAAIKAVIEIVHGLLKQLPMVADAAVELILALADGLTEALPELLPAVVDVIIQIVDKLTEPDMQEKLIDAGIRLIGALLEGIARALPSLILGSNKITMNLVKGIIQAAPKILSSGFTLARKLVEGLLQGLPSISQTVSNIGQSISDFFTNIGRTALNWGKDLIVNFTNGILKFINKPIEAIKGLAGKIKSFLGFSEPDEGPLSDFHTYAPDMMALFAKGIRDNASMITDAIDKAFNIAPEIAQATAGGAGGREFAVPRGGMAVAGRNMTIILETDGVQWARANVPYIEAEQQRYGVTLTGKRI